MPLVPPIDESVGRRAAQYVRMSTDPQKYSIEIQAAAIAAYAARRQIEIVQTYSDPGRSGLRIAGRDGLQALINDVERRRTNFDCILVYDVSRWGRFQDVDESAYYEFICKRAGIDVHYCAEEFENDGSVASVVLKNLKRVRAADFSRALSKNVFLGQCNIVSLGYWRGGPAAYGLRRMLIGEDGRQKIILQYKQRKNLKSERVILVPGPKSEIRIVNRIFTSFAIQRKTRTEIAAELNADGITNARGKPWSMLTVSNILKNEVYLGHLVYNRRSMKLREKQVRNPPERWIRHNHAFKAIIAPKLFAKAKKRLQELEGGRKQSDQHLLDRLAALWRRKGHLSVRLVQAAKGIPDPAVYARRFGSLMQACERIGFKPRPRYRFIEVTSQIEQVIGAVVGSLSTSLEAYGVRVMYLEELHLLTLADGMTVVLAVARSVSDGTTRARRWEVRKIRYKKADFTLVVRMETNNTTIRDYFLVPTLRLPLTRDRKKLRISDRLFGQSRLQSPDAVISAIRNNLLRPQMPERSQNSLPPSPIRRAATKGRASPARLPPPKRAQPAGRSKGTAGRGRR